MPTLSIKNVPQEVVDRLHARATANHRSLQGELMALVSQAVAPAPSPVAEPRQRSGGTVPIESIAAEHRQRWPEPFAEGPRAVDIIRGERDAR